MLIERREAGMGLRQYISDLKQIFPTIVAALMAIAVAGAAIWLLPNRTAAVILGVLAAFALAKWLLRGLQRTTQIALLWLSIGVVADAAYAKLNDLAPVTIASLLVQFTEALVKLIDILIRSVGIAGPNMRAQIAAVTPDFVWAVILTTALLLVVSLTGRQRNSGARPELRRAA
jgi:hypothetical protein